MKLQLLALQLLQLLVLYPLPLLLLLLLLLTLLLLLLLQPFLLLVCVLFELPPPAVELLFPEHLVKLSGSRVPSVLQLGISLGIPTHTPEVFHPLIVPS